MASTVGIQYAEHPEEAAANMLKSSPIFRRYVRPCCAEILGTFILTFVSTFSVTAATETSRPIIVSLAQGAAILMLYGSLAPISGGHYNPAISFSSWLGGSVNFITLLLYMISQMLGAFLGALLFRAVLPRDMYLISVIPSLPIINFSYTTIGQAILMELIGTFLWSLTMLLTTAEGNRPLQLAGPIIGSAVFIASLLSYNATKASINPAKAFGSTLAYTVFASGEWNEHYVFWVGPFLGATLAVFFYRLMLANDSKRLIFTK